MATTYTTESFTIDGVNFKDVQCYGKNDPSINGYASMIRQWIKQKYPKYSGANGVSVTNSKFANGFSISVDFNRIPEDDFDKIRSEIIGFFQASLHSQGYHYTSSGKKHTATNGDVYNIFIKYLDVKNYPKYGNTAYNSPAPDWSSMAEPTKSTSKGTFKKYPKREDFGKFIKECAGWDIYEKNGSTYLKKQKDTEPNREKWSEILGYMNTQEGFLWRRNLQAFERNVILNEEQLNMVCALLSRFYTSKQEPTTQPITQTTTSSTFPPKYFAVHNDSSAEFIEFINWFNYTYQTNYNGSTNWYGTDSSGERAVTDLVELDATPQAFTAKEFMDNLRASGQAPQQPTATTFPPKYFIVKRDNTDDYKDYIDWLNEKYNVSVSGTMFEWYGVNVEKIREIVADDDASRFKGNPQQFTAKEFMDNLRASGQANQQVTTNTSEKELIENRINNLKKLALISSNEDAELFNTQIEKLNNYLKILN